MSAELTPEQQAAVEQRDTGLFVHANAGSGKTRVLVERFVRAVVEDGVPVDRILAITFTEKAAAELRARLRARFLELGERDRAREAEGAWVSTIHGFCSRLLRRHALLAGIDPEYEVLDETRAARIAIDAFDRALEDFLDPDEPERLDLAAAHTPDRLRRMVTTVHAKRRSAGEERPELPETEEPRLGDERAVARRRARGRARRARRPGGVAERGRRDREARALPRSRSARCRTARWATRRSSPRSVVKTGRTKALQGPAMQAAGEALAAWVAACAARRAHGDYVLLRELLRGYTARYAEAKERESAVDFDDLELLDMPAARGERGACASATARSSSTCSWTSSRTRTGSRSGCSSC